MIKKNTHPLHFLHFLQNSIIYLAEMSGISWYFDQSNVSVRQSQGTQILSDGREATQFWVC
jgi:hypothetical protein